MELPPGPRAPAAWQTIGWTVRPAAFLQRVHRRFGDPVTIRTLWTDEPMVLFSHPDAVRELFRTDPAAYELLVGLETGTLADAEFEARFGALLGVPEKDLIARMMAGIVGQISLLYLASSSI